MTSFEHSPLKIGGLGRAAIDIIVTVPTETAVDLLSHFGFGTTNVHLVEDKQPLLELAQELERHGPTTVCPGDPVSNTLHMMGICQQSRATPLALHWFGTVGPKNHEFRYSIDPVDSLRRVSVTPHCIAYDPRDNLALCVVAKETNRVLTILAQSNPGVLRQINHFPHMDVFVVLLLDLLRAETALLEHILQSGAYAVILGDTVGNDQQSREQLSKLASSGKLKWILGRFEEVQKLALVDSGSVAPGFQDVEIVGTQGASPVVIWDPAARALISLEVPPAINADGNELGAGDAYAGGYLHKRLLQNPIADSHFFAVTCAQRVLQIDCARVQPQNDFNVVFGSTIDRTSTSQTEATLFERVRIAPGLTLVSPGQKGVDQIGIRAATKLGLPCFCILPQGRRTEKLTEHNTDYFGDAYIKELDSLSYRYRTWAAVFLADGTLLLDFYGGEGSAATRDACHVLGRPLLDATSLNENDLLATVGDWVDRHAIRVLNIAGTRASLLKREQSERTELQTFRLLRFLAFRGAALPVVHRDALLAVPETEPLRIGVPNSAGQRTLFETFLREAYGVTPTISRRLFLKAEKPALEVVFARPRDLPTMLHEQAIDLALCGSDVLYEEDAAFEVLLDTGLFQCFIVLLGTHDQREVEKNTSVPLRIGSQYPRLASHLLSRTNMQASLRAINGTAEAWIKVGLLDAAIDTWQTGASADANSLCLYKIFMNTSLVVGTSPSATKAYDGRKQRFLNEFGSWLAGQHSLS